MSRGPVYAAGTAIVVNGVAQVRLGEMACEFCPSKWNIWKRPTDAFEAAAVMTARLLAQHVQICHAGTVAATHAAQRRLLEGRQAAQPPAGPHCIVCFTPAGEPHLPGCAATRRPALGGAGTCG